jgi:hypothetical protein
VKTNDLLHSQEQPGIEVQRRFPYRFFVVTFLWSWTIWLPLTLAGFHVIPLRNEFLAKASMPVLILAAFGPAVGAFYSLKTLDGTAALRRYLRGLRDLRLGWKVWIVPIVVLGGSTCAAWILPELWGTPRVSIRLSPRLISFSSLCSWVARRSWGGADISSIPLKNALAHGSAIWSWE